MLYGRLSKELPDSTLGVDVEGWVSSETNMSLVIVIRVCKVLSVRASS